MRMAPIPRPFRRVGTPGQPRLAAVLILLYPVDEMLYFALMRRAEYPGVHSGQISLPGGKHESAETFEQTALRETCEEFGVCDGIRILGALTPLYVPPSDFEIHPVVGYAPTLPRWKADPVEVAEIIQVSLHTLFDDQLKGIEDMPRAEMTLRVPFYHLEQHKVWGATAIILSEFEIRLRTALRI